MCGITGFLDLRSRTSADDLGRTVTRMSDAIRHRGPDEGQIWTDAEAGIALGFRRLAIIDVSPAGRQPMTAADGRYVVCYNGEIYNAEDLRRDLGSDAPAWRGHSDTEVLLAGMAAWGIEAAIRQTIGMFAIALWDRQERRLWLIRDRVGKKPLYWSLQNGHFLFGSELRTLRAHPAFAASIDRDALTGFARTGYVMHPRTIYEGVHQLPPGHILTYAADDEPRTHAYWSLADTIAEARRAPFKGSDAEAVLALEDILGDAVRRRMVADVPLGAFLSGGYDSSTVVALMQAASTRPVRTFSIGFREKAYDESAYARDVARHLGTDHTELIATPEDAQAVIPLLPEIYDEPFADSSQIPTYLVSKLARSHVTVAVSGDGGDEAFAGYNRYAQGDTFGRWIAPLPQAPRAAAGRAMQLLSPAGWDRVFDLVPERARIRTPGDKIHKLAAVTGATTDGFYRSLTSYWPEPERIVLGGTEPETPRVSSIAGLASFVERMQVLDTESYLPGDILTKVDRASMAVSLEARCPILDHRVLAFAWSLPLSMKIRGRQSKWVLRQVAHRHIPAALLDRPKTGFGVPIGDWMRGPLRDWAENLLDESALRGAGLFDPAPIRQHWSEHLSGRRNWSYALWTILMFEAWRRAHH